MPQTFGSTVAAEREEMMCLEFGKKWSQTGLVSRVVMWQVGWARWQNA